MVIPMPHEKNSPEKIIDRLVVRDSGCWEWTGYNVNGYGRSMIDGKVFQVHRVVYEHLAGPIPPGLYLDHLCRNPPCANPDHLEPVTNQENQLRGVHGNKTTCPQNHPYDEKNTYIYRGKRHCRRCHAIRETSRRKAQAESKKEK